jgi:hypothetical protein
MRVDPRVKLQQLLLGLAFATLVAACSAYDSRPASRNRGIGKEVATRIGKAEIARRHIRLPAGTTIRVIEDEIIIEFRPEIPIYAVSFYSPDPRRSIPLYSVFVHHETGKVYDFIDTHRIIRGGR